MPERVEQDVGLGLVREEHHVGAEGLVDAEDDRHEGGAGPPRKYAISYSYLDRVRLTASDEWRKRLRKTLNATMAVSATSGQAESRTNGCPDHSTLKNPWRRRYELSVPQEPQTAAGSGQAQRKSPG